MRLSMLDIDKNFDKIKRRFSKCTENRPADRIEMKIEE